MKGQILKDTSKNRDKLLILNSATSLISQAVSIVCSFLLTRFILLSFGSDVNGLVSSISQFLGFISFLEMGIGAVVKSALYKPLAEKDYTEVSKIVISTKRFYKVIGLILLAYTGILTVVFPIISGDSFDYLFTGSLVVIISISLFAEYFFGTAYRLLINADQRTYVPTIVTCVTLLINTVISIVLMYAGASIQIVKLAASLIYVSRPILYALYVKKNYPLNEKIKLTEEPLKQKWNGVAQHIAYVVTNYTDIVVLTFFSTYANVSIYTIYHNVTLGVQQIINAISVGISAMLGNVLYSENTEHLQRTFAEVEWFFHFVTVLFFTLTGLLIIPFVRVYTSGVSDANYIVPLFAFLITLAQASYSLRTPYETMVLAANHFKQTQMSAVIEALLNVSISVILVKKFGLIGVAIGTFIAMTYRTLYFVNYLSKNILYYRKLNFAKYILVDVIQVVICVLLNNIIFTGLYDTSTIVGWILLAIKTGIICLAVCLGFSFVFYKEYLYKALKMFMPKHAGNR